MLRDVYHMATVKSSEYKLVFTDLLCDVQTLHSDVFTTSDLEKTLQRVDERFEREGIGFLTKTLPRLGRHLDKVLAEQELFDSASVRFEALPNSKLPRFLGELFQQVLAHTGEILPDADVACVRDLRQLLYVFYKLELPSDPELEQEVISRFLEAEKDLAQISQACTKVSELCNPVDYHRLAGYKPAWLWSTIRGARRYLYEVFKRFDHLDIYPRHGPGAVATREKLWGKYQWTEVPSRLTDTYALDEYFYSSLGHFCDHLEKVNFIQDSEPYARVVLVPKDSRGPRLISCEPLAIQWVQQGLSRAIVMHVERHHLTRDSVRFTDQEPNRNAAILSSRDGKYATLDLKEASDRVSLGLVRLLFPEPLLGALLASRSLGTTLPNGQKLELTKFAPMGSALCFPVMALTIWSILRAGLETFGATRRVIDGVYVYGDDVVVPTAYAEHAMNILESFGLKINRDKSCTKGLFRESCGMDAFRGTCVTPVRFRTPWTSHRRPETYVSWISYANSLYDRSYKRAYYRIVDWLVSVYGGIPEKADGLTVPSLNNVPATTTKLKVRFNPFLQKKEYLVYDVFPKTSKHELDGWSMLLRFFAEANSKHEALKSTNQGLDGPSGGDATREAFDVREYTWRRRIEMRRCWR